MNFSASIYLSEQSSVFFINQLRSVFVYSICLIIFNQLITACIKNGYFGHTCKALFLLGLLVFYQLNLVFMGTPLLIHAKRYFLKDFPLNSIILKISNILSYICEPYLIPHSSIDFEISFSCFS